jgi:DNA ligase-1
MIKEPFEKRRALLEKIVKQINKKIVLSKAKIVKNEDDVNKFFKESLAAGNEGLMLKKLDAPYKPGARVGYMVKMKETEEPLDLVITETEWGEGKRTNWFSSFTLACLDENGNFVEIGKVGTGIKEKSEEGVSFEELTNLLKPLVINQKGKVAKVKPKIVVEVAYEEIQKSPTYSSGYALRFPRVLRLRNMERSAEDVADLQYIEEYYLKQRKRN